MERELVVRALAHMSRTDRTLTEDESRMARRLIATIKPPSSIPDDEPV